MKRAAFALTLVVTFLVSVLAGANLASGGAAVEDSWTTVAPLPKPYYGVLGAAAVDGKIYFVGEEICERYDPDTNSWAEIAPLPIYSMWATVVACQNKIYVIGQPTQVYDPSTDTWENRTSIPATIFGYKAIVVDNKIYVISGRRPAPLGILDTSDANYAYDPAADSWSKRASIPTPVTGYASAVLDNKIYIIGGGLATYTVNNSSSIVQIFDPKTNQWTTGKPMLTGVINAGACSTSGLLAPKRIYVVGGELIYSPGADSSSLANHGTTLNQVYDPETGEWSSAASIPEIRWSLSLVNVEDELFAVGGQNDTAHSIYDDQYRKGRLAAVHAQTIEKYIPIGYEGTLSPTPSTSPNSTSTDSQSSAPDGLTANLFPIIPSAVVIVIVVIAGLAVYHKKFKKNT